MYMVTQFVYVWLGGDVDMNFRFNVSIAVLRNL